MIHSVTSLENFQETVAKNGVVIVKFTAQWCPPCKVIAPHYKSLAEDATPSTAFLEVDVDAQGPTADECDVQAMPTFQAYVRGARVSEVVDPTPAALKTFVADAISLLA